MRGPVRRLVRGAAAVAAVILLAACGEEPTPPRLTGFVPADPSVIAGESIDIRVEYEANDVALDAFQWTAEAGEVESNGKPAITYRAPDAPGAYKLTVTTTAVQDGLPDLSLDTVVEVLPAPEPARERGAQPPARLPWTPNAGQRAAAAARAALQGTGSEALQAGEEAADAAQAGVEEAAEEVTQATGGTAPQHDADRSAGEGRGAAAAFDRARCRRRRRGDRRPRPPRRRRRERLRALLVRGRRRPGGLRRRHDARVRAALARRSRCGDLRAGDLGPADRNAAGGRRRPDRGGADQDGRARGGDRLQPDLLQGRPAHPGRRGCGGRRALRSRRQEGRGGRRHHQPRQHQGRSRPPAASTSKTISWCSSGSDQAVAALLARRGRRLHQRWRGARARWRTASP